MSRSVKKGPFVAFSLLKKIDVMNASEEKKIIKTWSRASTILPSFVVIQLRFTMEGNTYRCISQKTWLAINLANLLRPVHLRVIIRAINNRED